LVLFCVIGGAEINASEESRFIRVRRDNLGNPVALESSIVRYEPADTTVERFTVDLISAVHIGEESYYRALNEEFKSYDAVLYELIAPKNAEEREGGTANPISAVQVAMKNLLGLYFQLEAVDYQASNFVHADMSPEEVWNSMRRREESFLRLFMRVLIFSHLKQNLSPGRPPDLANLAGLVLGASRALALKRLIAEEFADMELMVEMIDGPEGSTLVSERNKVALRVLRQELKRGRRRLAVFYGGAHMPDMERRLKEGFGLQAAAVRWLTAWDLRSAPALRR